MLQFVFLEGPFYELPLENVLISVLNGLMGMGLSCEVYMACLTCNIVYCPCPSHHSLAQPTMRELRKLVRTDQPRELGLQLNLDEKELDIVVKDHPTDHDRQLSDVLSLYLRQSLDPSWQEVVTALWNIGEKRRANDIAEIYGMALLLYQHALISYTRTLL